MIPTIIAIVGGAIGAIGGTLALWDRWRHRRPQLKLSIPAAFQIEESNRSLLCILLRIANNRRSVATLYLETLKASVRSDRTWFEVEVHTMTVAGRPGARPPGMNDNETWLCGIEEVEGLKRYTDNTIDYDHPLTGYLALVTPSCEVLHSADSVRFKIEDCHGRSLTVETKLPDHSLQRTPTPAGCVPLNSNH